MNSNMIGLINMREDRPLKEINDTRPLATLPIGGKYRLIDFTLSNMVNAGIENVGSCSRASRARSWTTSVPGKNGAWPIRATGCFICRKNGPTSKIPSKATLPPITRI